MKGKKVLATLLGATMILGATGCGGGESGGRTKVKFLYTGTNVLMQQMKVLIDTYNDGQGKTDKIQIVPTPVVDSGYQGSVNNLIRGRNSPDIYMTRDEYFKVYTEHYYDWNDYAGIDNVLEKTYDSISYRMRYNRETMTSNETDSLYALPFYNNISTLFYNKSIMQNMGITCISVPEDKLDEFNAGTYRDLNGKTKAEYNLTEKAYARGFFRYDNKNFVSPATLDDETTYNGSTWVCPAAGTVMVFNDQIPLSFDEVEDVGMYMTKSKNANSISDYGYYTEWWFNYGWSVGGDCMEDIGGSGDFSYTLPDDSKNYIVNEGKSYTGEYTGKVYTAGQTLEWLDKMEVAKTDSVVAKDDGTFEVGGAKVEERSTLAAKVASGDLTELPSIRETFSRFAMLSGAGGLNVSPKPTNISGSTVSYFYSGKIAMCIERLDYAESIYDGLSQIGQEWGIAYCPIYKEYEDAQDGDSAVLKQGTTATHSIGYGLAVKKTTKLMDKCQVFIEWLLDEGQQIIADNGYMPTNMQYEQNFMTNASAKRTLPNPTVALGITKTSQAGDWWYMPDRTWIDGWATALNSSVRNGTMSLKTFFDSTTKSTNLALKAY